MEVLTVGKIKTTNVTKRKYHADYLLHRFPLGIINIQAKFKAIHPVSQPHKKREYIKP